MNQEIKDEIKNNEIETTTKNTNINEISTTPSPPVLLNPSSSSSSTLFSNDSSYSFMNISWVPNENSTLSNSLNQQSSDEVDSNKQLQSELEKNKIKNSIFVEALSSLQKKSEITSIQNQTSFQIIPKVTKVDNTFHDLLKEEDRIVQQVKEKVISDPPSSSSSSVTTTTENRNKLKKNRNNSQTEQNNKLKTKKVITTTTESAWLELMKEEESMKQSIESKNERIQSITSLKNSKGEKKLKKKNDINENDSFEEK